VKAGVERGCQEQQDEAVDLAQTDSAVVDAFFFDAAELVGGT
jgi:hypothetical protein